METRRTRPGGAEAGIGRTHSEEGLPAKVGDEAPGGIPGGAVDAHERHPTRPTSPILRNNFTPIPDRIAPVASRDGRSARMLDSNLTLYPKLDPPCADFVLYSPPEGYGWSPPRVTRN